MTARPLTSPFSIADVRVANRVLLAPLAGIGNWFVRLQARRHGAGLTVSEMVSSFGLHYRNERTERELLRIHPDEHPVSVQLFGQDPEVMRSAAAMCAEGGADLIDINMGCPVRKVRKTGAGASLLEDPDLAVAIAAGRSRGRGYRSRSNSAPGSPRRSLRVRPRDSPRRRRSRGDRIPPAPGDRPAQGRAGLRARPGLAEALPVPMIISGGLHTADAARRAYEESGADAVMIARGSLGNPWIFEELTGERTDPPSPVEIVEELLWVVDRAEEHLGPLRAARYLRKFYPWYLDRLQAPKELSSELQRCDDLERSRELIGSLALARV